MKLKDIVKKSILFLPIFIPFFVVRFSLGPIPTTLLEVVIWAVFVLNLAFSNIKIKLSWQLFLVVMFLLAGLISVIIDPNLVSGLGLYKAYFIDGFLVYLLAVGLSQKEKDTLSNLLIFSAVVASVGAIVLYAQGIQSADGRIVDLSLLSSNYLAMYLAPIFILTIAKMRKKVGLRMYFLSLSSLILLLAMYLTYSRGIIVAVVPAIIYLVYLQSKNKTKATQVVFIILALAFLVGGYLYYQPDWSDHGRKATSSNVRYYIWSTSVEMIKANPVFGIGLSNYQDYFTELTRDRVNYPEFISPQALSAHNLYLQLYLTSGILGLITFVGLAVMALYRARKVEYIALFIAILVYGLVDTPFYRNDLAILIWITLAICYENRD